MKTEMAHDRIGDKVNVMARRVWREGWLTVPGISVALLPKLACPLCWPFYSGIVSSIGLGFLISPKYLLTFTMAFLILTFGALAYHAKQRRGYGPFVLGIVGAVAVLIGKFDLQSTPVTFTGIVVQWWRQLGTCGHCQPWNRVHATPRTATSQRGCYVEFHRTSALSTQRA